jgi:hypothetical protein
MVTLIKWSSLQKSKSKVMPKKFYNAATSTGFSTLDMGVLLHRKTVYLKVVNSALTTFRLSTIALARESLLKGQALYS